MMEGFGLAQPDPRPDHTIQRRAFITCSIGAGIYTASDKHPVPNSCQAMRDQEGLCEARLKKQGHLSIEKFILVCGRAVISR